MLSHMMSAEVGDDVFGEDPTINQFQEKVARMFGMEAGLFVPSGTMSNQLCVKVLTQPGDEILIDELGHIFNYETGATPVLSGVQISTIKGKYGKLSTEILKGKVRGKFDWEPRTTVLCLENSTNKGGGVYYTREELIELREFCNQNNLFLHIDGARIWNAITASAIEPSFFGEVADSISVCFSKGLGAPVGSMLLSTSERVTLARRYRKMWGGGMRQAGILAAAADFALQNNWKHLEIDHQRARLFAEKIGNISSFEVDMATVQTNIVIFEVNTHDSEYWAKWFSENGIGLSQFGEKKLRATFHFQISANQFEELMTTLDLIT
jgi:threonine aldolase